MSEPTTEQIIGELKRRDRQMRADLKASLDAQREYLVTTSPEQMMADEQAAVAETLRRGWIVSDCEASEAGEGV